MPGLSFTPVGQEDPLAAPLLAGLADEYATRYGGSSSVIHDGLRGYPAAEFRPPHGALVMGLLHGLPVTGGAFRDFGVLDGRRTAELKRIWTDARYRRRGYARLRDPLPAEREVYPVAFSKEL